jgi:hypothetical protein
MATKSSKVGLSNITVTQAVQIPNLLKTNCRIFAGYSGGSGGTSAVFYTVPQGMVVFLDTILCVEEIFITFTASTRFFIRTASGASIVKLRSGNSTPIGQNLIVAPIKLLAGDEIYVEYKTSDVSGAYLFFLAGTLQIDPLSYNL